MRGFGGDHPAVRREFVSLERREKCHVELAVSEPSQSGWQSRVPSLEDLLGRACGIVH